MASASSSGARSSRWRFSSSATSSGSSTSRTSAGSARPRPAAPRGDAARRRAARSPPAPVGGRSAAAGRARDRLRQLREALLVEVLPWLIGVRSDVVDRNDRQHRPLAALDRPATASGRTFPSGSPGSGMLPHIIHLPTDTGRAHPAGRRPAPSLAPVDSRWNARPHAGHERPGRSADAERTAARALRVAAETIPCAGSPSTSGARASPSDLSLQEERDHESRRARALP